MVLPRLRLLIAGFSPRRPGFIPREIHVQFLVEKVTLGQAFLGVLPCQYHINSCILGIRLPVSGCSSTQTFSPPRSNEVKVGGDKTCTHNLIGDPEGMKSLDRHRESRWVWDMDWIHLALNRIQWRDAVNTVTNLWVPTSRLAHLGPLQRLLMNVSLSTHIITNSFSSAALSVNYICRHGLRNSMGSCHQHNGILPGKIYSILKRGSC
jgi:hypothetical protein